MQMIPAPRRSRLIFSHHPIARSAAWLVPSICSPFCPFQRRYRVNHSHRSQQSNNSNRIRYATLAFSPCRRGEALQYRSSILSNSLPCQLQSDTISPSLSPRSHRFPALRPERLPSPSPFSSQEPSAPLPGPCSTPRFCS